MKKRKKKYKLSALIIIFIISIGIGFIFNSDNSVKAWVDSQFENTYSKLEDFKDTLKISDIDDTPSEIMETTITSVSKENLQIFYFNVGQADSIFISVDGHNMLIDAGNNEDGILICNYLKQLDIYKIDYLIGTHPHEDHIGGLDDVINNFEVETVFMPDVTTTTQTFEDVLDALTKKDLSITIPKIDDVFHLGSANCSIKSITNNSTDLNLSSIVIQLNYKEQNYLFMGDAEIENEKTMNLGNINVVKIGHHGSTTSTGNEFISKIKPEIAIISVGKDNKYGHPATKVLNRLKNYNVTVYRTDLDGTILLTSDGYTNKIEKINTVLDGNCI